MPPAFLSFAIWIPVAAGLVVLAVGSRRAALSRMLALFGALAGFLVALPLYIGFDATASRFQFGETSSWIPTLGVHYALGVDGLSLWFVLLNSLITVLVIVAGWRSVEKRVSQYNAAFLIMSGLLNGIFSALDGALFYVFFEASLIPLFLIIGIWGGPRRVYAAFKFFLYTLAGSLPFLLAIIYLRVQSGSFSLPDWQNFPLDHGTQLWLFFAFFAAFAVKIPMFPLHTWLPDAHVEAPTGGSVVLAAIALKLGAYGFLRFLLPIVPDAAQEMAPFMIALSLIAVVYIGLIALVQEDMKKLVAYSSIAHMGFVTMGIFLCTALSLEGALLQMISHGFVSAAMFLCIGVLYDRLHSRQIEDYGGVADVMPRFSALFLLFSMANAALPATSGFVGEFMVIMAAAGKNFWIALAAGSTLVIGAAYTLWMYKRVCFGAAASEKVRALSDLSAREFALLLFLALAVLGMGVYPFPVTEATHTSVAELLRHVTTGKIP
ncbi:MAG: NADH-quinone oxidoreductase subunit M [Zoogloeaceae bacterium]|jgi:NADH-quinone oxidoreductase subunit M|nr:NADH-quinone oxidoreductase subunit M [Zoogloeaceae bacterium]